MATANGRAFEGYFNLKAGQVIPEIGVIRLPTFRNHLINPA
jgi:hypothetical protein